MTDYLRRKVEQTRALLEAKLQDVASLRGQLQAYEDALTHSAAVPASSAAPAAAALDQRVHSAPNAYWATLVADLSNRGDRFTIDDVVRELKRLGKKLERKSVRAKLTDLVKDGAVIRLEDGVFRAAPRGVSGDELRALGIIPQHARMIGEDAA